MGFTSARWGSLASFGARSYKDTKKMYGTTGNSFVAVVEFGDRVQARAVSAGGESGDRVHIPGIHVEQFYKFFLISDGGVVNIEYVVAGGCGPR